MPVSAVSINPAFPSLAAPVNAPFEYPNSSLSISESGMVPQLIFTKGRSFRRLIKWIIRASMLLPTPDSPWSSTEVCTPATFTDFCTDLGHGVAFHHHVLQSVFKLLLLKEGLIKSGTKAPALVELSPEIVE